MDLLGLEYYDDPTGSSDEALVQADGTLAPTAAVSGRPYPQAVAGTPISDWFELQNKDFQLVYTPSADVKAPTMVFVPATSTRRATAPPCGAGG